MKNLEIFSLKKVMVKSTRLLSFSIWKNVVEKRD